MSTAIILRPSDAPKLWVLEVDGPRQKYVQRGEGSYYLATNNHPCCDNHFWLSDQAYDPRLKDWDLPSWEIIQNHDGSIEVLANRPTEIEVREGDLHGALGSVIKITWACRPILRNALRLASVSSNDPTLSCPIHEHQRTH